MFFKHVLGMYSRLLHECFFCPLKQYELSLNEKELRNVIKT